MNEAEFNYDDVIAEAEGVLHKKLLPPPAYDEDVVHPSELHAINAMTAFERSIQRPYVLVFFESNPGLLSQTESRGRTAKFRDGIFGYLKKQAMVLRSCKKNGEADVLEKTDGFVISDIVQKQVAQEIKKLGDQLPGTDAYRRIDSRIKFLDRWDKLCDELVDFERSEGTD